MFHPIRVPRQVSLFALAALMLTMLSVGRASAQDSWATMASDPDPKFGSNVSVEINGRIYVYGFEADAAGNQSR
jgi:hypothetical protein